MTECYDKWVLTFQFFLSFRTGGGGALLPQKRVDRQINEDVRRMMTSLFNVLEPELNNFILSFEKLDSLYVHQRPLISNSHILIAFSSLSRFVVTQCTCWCV